MRSGIIQVTRWVTIISAVAVIVLSVIVVVHAQSPVDPGYQVERNTMRIDRLAENVHALERGTVERVAILENRMLHVENELSKLIDRIYLLLFGVCAQMFHIVWSFIDRRRKQ